MVALAVHIVALDGADHDRLLHSSQDFLAEHDITHATIQIDRDHDRLLQIHRRDCSEAPTLRGMNRASVVVIGGGVMGTSIAFHLAEAGVADVLLLERGQLAEGSTSRAAGGVRAQFSDPLNVQIGAAAWRRLRGSRAAGVGDRSPSGRLPVSAHPPRRRPAFTQSVEMQNRLGVPSRMITPQEAKQLSPLINVDDVLAAAYSPDDGHATPEAVVQGYASGARAAGAVIQTGCEVRAIETSDGAITAVITDRGTVETQAVVCAAGAWSASVGEMAGVPLPVTPVRRQILYTEPIENLPEHVPDDDRLQHRVLLSPRGPGPPDGDGRSQRDARVQAGCDRRLDPRAAGGGRAPSPGDHRGRHRRRVGGAVRGLARPQRDRGRGEGACAVPVRHRILGPRLLQGPAVGEIVRDLYLGREPFVDVSPLSADRFGGRDMRPERNVV